MGSRREDEPDAVDKFRGQTKRLAILQNFRCSSKYTFYYKCLLTKAVVFSGHGPKFDFFSTKNAWEKKHY